jgi:hypothetical protein
VDVGRGVGRGVGDGSPPPCIESGIAEEFMPKVIDAMTPPGRPVLFEINSTDRSEELPPCPLKIPSTLFKTRVML